MLTETWCNTAIDNAALTIENYKIETESRKDRCETAEDSWYIQEKACRFYPVT